jgi:hypothetical protein
VSLAIEARPAGFQVVTQQESWKFLSAHISSQNHYRDHDAGDDQAKGYGARDNFKFVPVLCEMQAWEQQFPKIIFQHEKPLIGIKSISAPIPFNVHTFCGKYILKPRPTGYQIKRRRWRSGTSAFRHGLVSFLLRIHQAIHS